MNRRQLTLLIGAAILIVGLPGLFLLETKAIDTYQKTQYNLTYTVTVENFGPSQATDIPLKLALLEDEPPFQDVVVRQVTPQPDRILTDSLNNTFGVYGIDSIEPDQNFTVQIDAVVDVNSIDFNIRGRDFGSYSGEKEKYMLSSRLVESDHPLIQRKAREIRQNNTYLTETLRDTYTFIIDTIEYEQQPGELGAVWALQNKEGGSAEFGNLFVALARANQVPARRVSGWANSFPANTTLRSPQFAHGWAEFYLPAFGWVPVDPVWGRTSPFDYFAGHRNTRIIMARGADVHVFTRGSYNTPYGSADVNTQYKVTIHEKNVQNLSARRTMVLAFFFIIPVLFALFVAYQIKKFYSYAE